MKNRIVSATLSAIAGFTSGMYLYYLRFFFKDMGGAHLLVNSIGSIFFICGGIKIIFLVFLNIYKIKFIDSISLLFTKQNTRNRLVGLSLTYVSLICIFWSMQISLDKIWYIWGVVFFGCMCASIANMVLLEYNLYISSNISGSYSTHAIFYHIGGFTPNILLNFQMIFKVNNFILILPTLIIVAGILTIVIFVSPNEQPFQVINISQPIENLYKRDKFLLIQQILFLVFLQTGHRLYDHIIKFHLRCTIGGDIYFISQVLSCICMTYSMSRFKFFINMYSLKKAATIVSICNIFGYILFYLNWIDIPLVKLFILLISSIVIIITCNIPIIIGIFLASLSLIYLYSQYMIFILLIATMLCEKIFGGLRAVVLFNYKMNILDKKYIYFQLPLFESIELGINSIFQATCGAYYCGRENNFLILNVLICATAFLLVCFNAKLTQSVNVAESELK